MNLVEVDGERAQIGTPHGMSQCKCSLSVNILTSVGNRLGMNLSNSLLIAIVTNKNVPTVHLKNNSK